MHRAVLSSRFLSRLSSFSDSKSSGICRRQTIPQGVFGLGTMILFWQPFKGHTTVSQEKNSRVTTMHTFCFTSASACRQVNLGQPPSWTTSGQREGQSRCQRASSEPAEAVQEISLQLGVLHLLGQSAHRPIDWLKNCSIDSCCSPKARQPPGGFASA